MKKLISSFLALCLVLSLFVCGSASADGIKAAPGSNLVILYTNDVHCGVNDNITYKGLAEIKNALEAAGRQVLLVDCGDAVQGDSIGTLSKGEYIIDIMNALGYAAAIPGNHEFDYTMDRFFELTEMAEFPYIAANFVRADGSLIFDPYIIIEADGAKIAFVGVCTPKTLTSSTPAYFMDDSGEFVYGFCQDETGAEFYAAVQSAVDAARAEGADYVIALTHLGIEAECSPYTSSELITNTTGIDAVLDGHSHSVIKGDIVKNAAGENVPLSSTGTKLAYVGCLTIGADGTLSTALIDDGGVGTFIDGINAQLEALTNQTVAHTDVDLCITDPQTGKRMIRSNETNLGDLCADAYRVLSGADIAFINGGAVRSDVPAGDITYGQIISVFPFGTEMCVVEASGQEILDALELSAYGLPGEFGGFLHVSGMCYTIDLSVDSPVVLDEDGFFASADGPRRVKDVTVGGEPIAPEAMYSLASDSYKLHNRGDGYSMFADNVFIQDGVMLDNQVLINFIVENLSGVVGKEYADPYGEGRISIING